MSNTIRKLIILSAVLLFAGLPAFAQKVTLKLNEVKVQAVLLSIKQQTKLSFVYSDQIIDVNRIVSINMVNAEISEVLDALLKGTDTGYEIRDQYFGKNLPR